MTDRVCRRGFKTLTSIKDVVIPANKVHVNASFRKRPCHLGWISTDWFTVNWYKKQDFIGFLGMFSN